MKDVIFIPGLGDEMVTSWVERLVGHWRNKRTQLYFFDARWNAAETFTAKKQRFLTWLDELNLKPESEKLLYGISAGGALAMVVFGERKSLINKMILIAPKLQRAELIGPKYRQHNPALVQTVEASQAVMDNLSDSDKLKIISHRPLIDDVIARADMVVEGAETKTIPFIGHALSIGFALLFLVRPR